jgi:hypothetical protein
MVFHRNYVEAKMRAQENSGRGSEGGTVEPMMRVVSPGACWLLFLSLGNSILLVTLEIIGDTFHVFMGNLRR